MSVATAPGSCLQMFVNNFGSCEDHRRSSTCSTFWLVWTLIHEAAVSRCRKISRDPWPGVITESIFVVHHRHTLLSDGFPPVPLTMWTTTRGEDRENRQAASVPRAAGKRCLLLLCDGDVGWRAWRLPLTLGRTAARPSRRGGRAAGSGRRRQQIDSRHSDRKAALRFSRMPLAAPTLVCAAQHYLTPAVCYSRYNLRLQQRLTMQTSWRNKTLSPGRCQWVVAFCR